MKAKAVFQRNIKGRITFIQDEASGEVSIRGDVQNLKPGKHALHIHTYGDLQSTDCIKCGGHWNPTNKDHGGRHDENSHAGDLGNITANEQGKATFAFKTKKFTLFGDVTRSVIGRSIIIHEDPDDNGKGGFHDSLITGHAGGRLDCAVIGHCKS